MEARPETATWGAEARSDVKTAIGSTKCEGPGFEEAEAEAGANWAMPGLLDDAAGPEAID